MTSSGLFDPGLQPERTLLAWRRTCLSLAVAIAAIVKVLAFESGAATIVVGGVGLGLSVVAWVLATRHYRRAHRALTRDPQGAVLPPSGVATFVALLATVLVGVLALLLVVR